MHLCSSCNSRTKKFSDDDDDDDKDISIIVTTDWSSVTDEVYPKRDFLLSNKILLVSCPESSVRMLASSQRLVYVVRDGTLQSRVSVRCQSLGGTAVRLVDYLPVYSRMLVFDVGVRWQTVSLTTLNGGKPVPDLDFHVVLFAAQGMHTCTDAVKKVCK